MSNPKRGSALAGFGDAAERRLNGVGTPSLGCLPQIDEEPQMNEH
jgi:hypothetical protein